MVQSNDITAVCVLAIKGPTGVTLEVNLRNPLHTGEEACKGGIHPGLEFQGRHYQKSKTGIWVTPQKELMSSKSWEKNTKFVTVSGSRTWDGGRVQKV